MIKQTSLLFQNQENNPPTDLPHTIRAADTTSYYLWIGEGGFFGGSVGTAEPARLRVDGRGWAGGTSLRFRFRYSKDASFDTRTGDVSSGTWEEMGIDRTFHARGVAVRRLRRESTLIDIPIPHDPDFVNAKAMRLQVTSVGVFTAGDFEAGIMRSAHSSPNVTIRAATRAGFATPPEFENLNDGRIN